MTGERISLH